MAAVKTQSTKKLSRRDRARATRQRIIAAAYELMCANGYGGTTVADVARAAKVAVQTVYFTFHTKAELLAGAYEYAVLGAENPLPPEQQPWLRYAFGEPDFDKALRSIAAGSAEITTRATPLESVVRATAASDPDVQAVWEHHEKLRLQGYRGMIDLLATKAPLAAGLTPERATELLLLYFGPHTYRGLVTDYEWSNAEYVDWTVSAVARDIFGRN
jgi:AcrR family transcriptional regulator